MKRVLVTGGAGYIGSHCCKALAEAGYEPVTFDNLSTGCRGLARFGPLIEGDVRDAAALDTAIAAYSPIGVMHFAALSLVGDSVRDPGRYYDVNVGGTLRLLEAMRKAAVSRLVFSSSCAVYGESNDVPIAETTPFNPLSPYGSTKHTCERLMDDFGHAFGLRSVRLRYFNAAGADAGGEIGESHDPETHLVPLVIATALGRQQHIRVFGTDYPTPDGTAIRDYIHVSDLADAHLAALRYLLDGGDTCALNVGTGAGHSVAEVVDTVRRVTGRPVTTLKVDRRVGDPPILVADPRRARSVLGWSATHGLESIVTDAWRWHAAAALT